MSNKVDIVVYHPSFYFPYHQTDVKQSGYCTVSSLFLFPIPSNRCQTKWRLYSIIPLSISHTIKQMSNKVDIVQYHPSFYFPYHQTDIKQSGDCTVLSLFLFPIPSNRCQTKWILYSIIPLSISHVIKQMSNKVDIVVYHPSFYFPYHQTDVKQSGYCTVSSLFLFPIPSNRCQTKWRLYSIIPLSISHTIKQMSNKVDIVQYHPSFYFPYHQTDVKQSGYVPTKVLSCRNSLLL